MTSVSPEQILWAMTSTAWSLFYPLNRGERIAAHVLHQDAIPNQPGIYCVSLGETGVPAYVGQSGNLRQRINALSANVYREQMPFTTPHFAAPGLWVLTHTQDSSPLTVSFASFESSAYWRQGVEDVAIALHRWLHKHHPMHVEGWPSSYSPLANYGRFCLGWQPSSSQARGKQGGPSSLLGPWHLPDIAPLGELDDQYDPFGETWGGHTWSVWRLAREVAFPSNQRGLYRLWKENSPHLWLLGFGILGSAVQKAARVPEQLFFSAVAGEWTERQMEELKVDLLGLYACQCQTFPVAQYGGQANPAAGSAWPEQVQMRDQEW